MSKVVHAIAITLAVCLGVHVADTLLEPMIPALSIALVASLIVSLSFRRPPLR